MTQLVQGSLVLLGLNTPTPQVFWNGAAVAGIIGIKTTWSAGRQKVKLVVNVENVELHSQLAEAGVYVKQEAQHE